MRPPPGKTRALYLLWFLVTLFIALIGALLVLHYNLEMRHRSVRHTQKALAQQVLSRSTDSSLASSSAAPTARTDLNTPFDCSSGLLAVTYASHGGSDDRFCRSLISAARHSVDLRVLGWQQPWRGLTQKLTAMLDFLRRVRDPNCTVMFNDAFDVIYSRDVQSLLTAYRSMRTDVVFSGECGCWPQIMRGRAACFDLYPKSPTPLRYLNSGQWIASQRSAVQLLEWLIGNRTAAEIDHLNDQELLSDLYMAQFGPKPIGATAVASSAASRTLASGANHQVSSGGFPAGAPLIHLDHTGRLFLALHRTDPPDLDACNPEDRATVRDGRWYYGDERPGVLHFNGGGKSRHLHFESKMWYHQFERNATFWTESKFWAGPLDASKRVSLENLCLPFRMQY